MSAKLESTYSQSPERTALRLKQPNLPMSSLKSASPNHEATDRLRNNKSNVTKNLQSIYLKETQRYFVGSYNNSPVVLTQYESSTVHENSSWKFFENMGSQAVEEQVSKFQVFLKKFGLLEVFKAFELCREKLIEILSDQERTVSNKSSLQVFEVIASLKMQLSKTHDLQTTKSQNDEDLKEMLMKLSQQRKDNDVLREKIAELSHRLKRYQNNQSFVENSLFQNSITFNSSSQYGEQSANQISFELQLQSLKIKQFQTFSNNFLDQSQKSISAILEQQFSKKQAKISQNMLMHQQQASIYSCVHHQSWKQVLKNNITAVKTMFKNHFKATNIALLKKECQKELTAILNSYKTYKRLTSQENQQAYLREYCHFIKFVEQHSNQLSILLTRTQNRQN